MATQGNEATVTIVNSNGAGITHGLANSRPAPGVGPPRRNPGPMTLTASLAYGPSAVYPLPTFWLSSVADIMSLQSFILSVYAEPAERVTGTWEAASDLDQATQRDTWLTGLA